jgi:hypothetical protein
LQRNSLSIPSDLAITAVVASTNELSEMQTTTRIGENDISGSSGEGNISSEMELKSKIISACEGRKQQHFPRKRQAVRRFPPTATAALEIKKTSPKILADPSEITKIIEMRVTRRRSGDRLKVNHDSSGKYNIPKPSNSTSPRLTGNKPTRHRSYDKLTSTSHHGELNSIPTRRTSRDRFDRIGSESHKIADNAAAKETHESATSNHVRPIRRSRSSRDRIPKVSSPTQVIRKSSRDRYDKVGNLSNHTSNGTKSPENPRRTSRDRFDKMGTSSHHSKGTVDNMESLSPGSHQQINLVRRRSIRERTQPQRRRLTSKDQLDSIENNEQKEVLGQPKALSTKSEKERSFRRRSFTKESSYQGRSRGKREEGLERSLSLGSIYKADSKKVKNHSKNTLERVMDEYCAGRENRLSFTRGSQRQGRERRRSNHIKVRLRSLELENSKRKDSRRDSECSVTERSTSEQKYYDEKAASQIHESVSRPTSDERNKLKLGPSDQNDLDEEILSESSKELNDILIESPGGNLQEKANYSWSSISDRDYESVGDPLNDCLSEEELDLLNLSKEELDLLAEALKRLSVDTPDATSTEIQSLAPPSLTDSAGVDDNKEHITNDESTDLKDRMSKETFQGPELFSRDTNEIPTSSSTLSDEKKADFVESVPLNDKDSKNHCTETKGRSKLSARSLFGRTQTPTPNEESIDIDDLLQRNITHIKEKKKSKVSRSSSFLGARAFSSFSKFDDIQRKGSKRNLFRNSGSAKSFSKLDDEDDDYSECSFDDIMERKSSKKNIFKKPGSAKSFSKLGDEGDDLSG